jgi:hypothetical protein
MDATQVVIHFIGLVLFSAHVSNDPGLHAILPDVKQKFFTAPVIGDLPKTIAAEPASAGHDTAHPPLSTANPNPSDAHVNFAPNIESHITLLIFHEDLVADDSQWPTSTIISRFPHAETLTSYKYVKLTGEHITFIAGAPNDSPVALPENLPHLSLSCPTTGLTSGYQWPYSKAAAVVDIPEGTLSTCYSSVAPGRIDTKLTLNTTGTLTVVAEKSGAVKTLVLNTLNNRTIYLVNVPPPRVKGSAEAESGSSHFYAYYSMIGKDLTSTCIHSPSASANMRVVGCDPVFFAPGSTDSDDREVPPMFSANAECSNTQWP